MMVQAHRGLRRKLAEAVYLIDSTGFPLNRMSAGRARFSANACGAKLHVVHDPDADRPIYAALSAAKFNDITAAHAMPIEGGATYVFRPAALFEAVADFLERRGRFVLERQETVTINPQCDEGA